MAKLVYIITGYNESINDFWYREAVKNFENNSFNVVPISIKRKYRVMTDYVSDFASQFVHSQDNEVYILWFSFGAMVALIATSIHKLDVKNLMLCSLSPYFKEDLLVSRKRWLESLWKKRVSDFQKYSFKKIALSIDSKTTLVFWEREPVELINRVLETEKEIKNTKL